MIDQYINQMTLLQKEQISQKIDEFYNYIISILDDPRIHQKIAHSFKTRNPDGPPFTDYEGQPDNISQVKKLVNALYYSRLALIDFEQLDFNSFGGWTNVFQRLLNEGRTFVLGKDSPLVQHAYKAAFLATHLDINWRELFQQELQPFLSLLSQGNQLITQYSDGAQKFAETIKDYPIVNKTGQVAGIALKQMQTNDGRYDYQFLTQFSTVLPSYIDALSQYIKKYSSQMVKYEPSFNNEQLANLQQAGLALLNDLEHLKTNSVFVSFKLLNYINIINNIITLAMSSLEQVGHFSQSTQNVIYDKLAKLKYEYFPDLFALIDSIELNFMLEPGTLATPLMSKMRDLYSSLTHYLSTVVDFSARNEFLSIEDSSFVRLRLDKAYRRISDAHKRLFTVEQSQTALKAFYALLPQFSDDKSTKDTIHQLPQERRKQLSEHYKIIQPYVVKVDDDFNRLMIESLLRAPTQPNSASAYSWFSWTSQKESEVHISAVLAKKALLEHKIAKDITSQQFHLDLNHTMIRSVQQQTDPLLLPFRASDNVFVIDESCALELAADHPLTFKQTDEQKVIEDPEQLSCKHALSLALWYQSKRDKLTQATDAYSEFMRLLKELSADAILDISKIQAADKVTYRRLYHVLQPYFFSGIPPAMHDLALKYDKYLVHALADNVYPIHRPKIDIFAKLEDHIHRYFRNTADEWQNAHTRYKQQASRLFIAENQLQQLTLPPNSPRAHYLLSDTDFSQKLKTLKEKAFALRTYLNAPMQAAIEPAETGLPFPDLKTAVQNARTLPFKHLFNSLYHLEAVVLQLEELNDKSYQYTYVYRLAYMAYHIYEIKSALEALIYDPHFSVIARDLLKNSQDLLATILEHSDAYKQAPAQITTVEGTVQYNSLWYSLNAFFISPKHIRSLRNNNYLTTEELNKLHERAKTASLTIEHLIRSSSSIVQLFLQAPQMLSLYKELTHKLNEFLSTVHDSTMNSLEKLVPDVFAPLMLAADQWEDRVGLQAGTITAVLKNIQEEFHKGLLLPLNLPSQIHIDLVCDNSTLIKRQQQVEANLEQATTVLNRLDLRYAAIKHLHLCLNNHEEHIKRFKHSPNSQAALAHSEEQLIAAYQPALSKLNSLQQKNHIHTPLDTEAIAFELDQRLNDSVRRYEPKLKGIKSLVNAAHFHYQSRKATYEMQRDTALDKQNYLQQLSLAQQEQRQQFITDYTQASFERQLNRLYDRPTGLKGLDKEYRDKLNDYLLNNLINGSTIQASIKEQAQASTDIDATIKKLLQQHSDTFARSHFAPMYHMDNIHTALNLFYDYSYFAKHSLFEDEHTLGKKSERISALIKIAADHTRAVESRFADINYAVNFNPSFSREMLAHRDVNPFSLTYLVLCIASLLEALYLYTSPSKKHYNSIISASKNEPTPNEVFKRFGLFVETAPKTAVLPEPHPEGEPIISLGA